jgi:hypothetical protein
MNRLSFKVVVILFVGVASVLLLLVMAFLGWVAVLVRCCHLSIMAACDVLSAGLLDSCIDGGFALVD